MRRTRPQFTLRQLMLAVVLSAPPSGLLAAGARSGCLRGVLAVWAAFVAGPLIPMGLLMPRLRSEAARDRCAAGFGAVAIVGYALAIPVSAFVIGVEGWE